MMDALIWAVAFVLMFVGGGGAAVLCVRHVEQGKNYRLTQVEKTKREGMQNAYQLEVQKLDQPALGTGKDQPSVISFDLAGSDDSWK